MLLSAQLLIILALSSINALGAYGDFPPLYDRPIVVLVVVLYHEIFVAKIFIEDGFQERESC